MSNKYESAELILKLYELRREEVMRKARDWFGPFLPNSAQDVTDAFMGEHSNYIRMVTTYWDMAASFVNHGAIDEQMFTDANGEHIAVFAKLEPFLAELRTIYDAPEYLKNLEQLVMRQPNAKARLAQVRERVKQYMDAMQKAKASQGKSKATSKAKSKAKSKSPAKKRAK